LGAIGGHSRLFVLAFAREGKLVLRLSIRNLVDTEPFVGGSQEPREMAFDILDVYIPKRNGVSA
jgi:hypothetical protein